MKAFVDDSGFAFLWHFDYLNERENYERYTATIDDAPLWSAFILRGRVAAFKVSKNLWYSVENKSAGLLYDLLPEEKLDSDAQYNFAKLVIPNT